MYITHYIILKCLAKLVKSILVCKFTRLKKLHQSVYAAKAVDDEYMAC